MTVSIIICTRNRAESLKPTLESIGRAIVPPGWNVELLVVDNGSTDHTHAVINTARFSNVILRYAHEPKTGLCHARNTGLRETSGQIILFTDDDIRVPLYWIEGMCRPVVDGAADAVAGGVVFPPHIADALARPPYSSRRSWFASTEELDRETPKRLVGANMAFHRHVLDRVPGFDVELGPGALGFHDETLFSLQLLAAGYKLVSALDIMVEHHFDLSRLTRKGMIDLARKMGRSHAFVFHHWEHQKSQLAFPRLVLSHLCRHWTQYSDRIKGNATRSASISALQVEQDLAFYREYLAQRRRPYKYPSRSLAPPVTRTALLSN
jgi:glycosyltransferase involved in cell wall biosynthesis